MNFKPGVKYCLRGGGWAKVLCVDAPNRTHPLVGHCDSGRPLSWSASGCYSFPGERSGDDLLQEEYCEPKTVTRDVWLVLRECGLPTFSTLDPKGDKSAHLVIGSAKATITVTEGQWA